MKNLISCSIFIIASTEAYGFMRPFESNINHYGYTSASNDFDDKILSGSYSLNIGHTYMITGRPIGFMRSMSLAIESGMQSKLDQSTNSSSDYDFYDEHIKWDEAKLNYSVGNLIYLLGFHVNFGVSFGRYSKTFDYYTDNELVETETTYDGFYLGGSAGLMYSYNFRFNHKYMMFRYHYKRVNAFIGLSDPSFTEPQYLLEFIYGWGTKNQLLKKPPF